MFGKRTELQELAYNQISDKKENLFYYKSKPLWLVVDHIKIKGSSRFLRKMDTVDYIWCEKYPPQKVRLWYLGEEHYLLIPKRVKNIDLVEVWHIENDLLKQGYNVLKKAKKNMTIPNITHYHVWK